MNIGDPIQILMIHHRHGVNVDACATEAGVTEQLYKYVEEYWSDLDDGCGPPPLPADRQEAIDQYFERFNDELGADEYYEIEQVPLLP